MHRSFHEVSAMTTLLERTSPEEIVAQLEPTLRQYAPAAELERRLAPQVMAAMVEAGVFRSLTPRAYGGMEMDPLSALRMFEAIARIDSAAGWIAGNSSGIATLGFLLPPEATDEIYRDPRTVWAGALFPPGTAVPAPGGYRVSGRWPFGSACSYATWLVGQALLIEDGAPRPGPDGNPVAMMVVVRADEAQVVDGTWQTLGMRGTGSLDYAVNDVFVPDRRTWQIGPAMPANPAFAGPLYRLGMWLAPPQIAGVTLAIAQAAVEDFIATSKLELPVSAQAISAWIVWFWTGMEASMMLGIGEKEGHQREALDAMATLLRRLEGRARPEAKSGEGGPKPAARRRRK